MNRILLLICFFFICQLALGQADTLTTQSTSTVELSDLTDKIADEERGDEKMANTDSSNLRTISAYEWEQMTQNKDFIYKHEKDNPKEKKEKAANTPNFDVSKFFNAGLFKIIFGLLVVFILGAIIYTFLKDSDFSSWRKAKVKPSALSPSFEEVEEFNNWDDALQDALQKNDYRLAIRIHYLQTLQLLNQQQLIDYEPNKTNWDYVKQMALTNHKITFMSLTRYFEYSWYGYFIVEPQQYDRIEQDFKHFRQSL